MTTDPHASPGQQPVGMTSPAEPPATASKGAPPDPTATPGDYLASPKSAVKFTRAAALWSSLIVGFLILILLLVFIMQNTDSTTIHLFGWEWNLPVGVAILFAAVCGGLLTVAVGTSRIIQLRRAAKRNLKAGT
ncbi:LapA family protein [Mycolicibacterium stellerae]|uniref:LapA family protein n=1 Tax=Mycolicibacterium stellerae TaxID=2358193 RepID=UPI000F0AFE4C|nr:lipopolysaccharide assembly protein LapA domain-containing protein [Mycolicibacterium stellerae]